MKIIKRTITICALLLFFFAIFAGAVMCKYTYFSQAKQDALVSDYIKSEIEYIYVDNIEESEQAVKTISAFLAELDANLTNDFFSKGWKIVLAEDALSQYTETSAGITVWDDRTIFLDRYEEPEVIEKVFVHEFGHYFDLANGYLSASSDFIALYDLYKDSYKEQDELTPEDYPRSSPQEFFASCFKEYHYYPEHLQTIAPAVYDFLDVQIQEATALRYKNIKTFIGGLRFMRGAGQSAQDNIKNTLAQ